jgi:hypothetical protein
MSFIGSNRRRALRTTTALGLVLSLSACGSAPTSGAVSDDQVPATTTRHAALGTILPLGILNGGVEQYTSQSTQFDPVVDGFHFVNDFTNIFGPFETSGLCGGMSYTALDYFNARMTIPQQSYRPEENTPLQSYIYGRQETSIENNSAWASWAINPFGVDNTAIAANSFAQQVPLVIASINQGKPIPLGLDGTNFGSGSHQVLAVGYSVDSNPNDTQISLYDPNHPGQKVTLVYNVAAQVFDIAEYPTEDQWIGFYADTTYVAQTPPTVPEPVYADDGLIHELFIVVGTGNDALQNGANAALNIGLTNGTVVSLPALNLGEKWVPNYQETVRYVLPTPLASSAIASVALTETDTCGPWSVTSTLVQAVGYGTWELATGGTQELGCGATNQALSIVQTQPAVTGVSPSGAPPGASVAITGAGFHTDGSTVVAFDGVPATTSCSSSTACTAIVPAGSGTVSLTLSEPVLRYSTGLARPPAPLQTFSVGAGSFSYPPPAAPQCGFTAQTTGTAPSGTISAACTTDAANDPIFIYTIQPGGYTLAYDYYTAGAAGAVLGPDVTILTGVASGTTTSLVACTENGSLWLHPGEAGCTPVATTVTMPAACVPATAASCSNGGSDGTFFLPSQCGQTLPDGCGGTFTCPACPVCVPRTTCASLGAVCATTDNCGNPLECGTCGSGDTCSAGHCCSTGDVWSTAASSCVAAPKPPPVINPPPIKCNGKCI